MCGFRLFDLPMRGEDDTLALMRQKTPETVEFERLGLDDVEAIVESDIFVSKENDPLWKLGKSPEVGPLVPTSGDSSLQFPTFED